MSHSFIAYIDESGDDGLDRFRVPGKQGGSSNWLTICACLIRASNQLEVVRWRDEIREGTKKRTKGRAIHFADFSHAQKRFAIQCLYKKPVRFTAAISNKREVPKDTFTSKNQLYFYITRYVIERISWFCRDVRPRVTEGDGRVKIIFSRRGGMSYNDFSEYMIRLQSDPEATIHWPVIDVSAIEAQDHSRLAGLQLADCGARAISEAFEPDLFGNIEAQYLEQLRERIYQRNGNFLSYGLKLLPHADKMVLPASQAAVIRSFRV